MYFLHVIHSVLFILYNLFYINTIIKSKLKYV